MHCAFLSSRSFSLSRIVDWSKPKYTVASVQPASDPEAAPAFRQNPSTQSSSSAQSSSLVHLLARLHAPAWQLPPGPHSLSAAQALHLPAWQTLPAGHCSSLVHSGVETQAFALHRSPLGHCESFVHSTHLFSKQTWSCLQSLSALQVPGFLASLPQLASATPSAAAKSARRTISTGWRRERLMAGT